MLLTFRASLCRLLFAAAFSLPLIARAEAPFVSSLSLPQSGTYDRSLVLRFTAEFSAPVTVIGAPRLLLNVGGQPRSAAAITPLGGGPTTRVDFEYVPQPFDNAPNGIAIVGRIDVGRGSITGVDGSAAVLSFAAPGGNSVQVAMIPTPTPQIRTVSLSPDAAGVVVFGTADANSVVTVTRENGAVIGQALAERNGAWRLACSASKLQGAQQIAAMAENVDGVPSAPSAPVPVADQTTAVAPRS